MQESIFLYHRVPENMHGHTLRPLNTLKNTNPELYAEYTKKYEGREQVLEDIIPILNCKWNDVIHLSPLHPGKIKTLFEEVGAPTKTWKYFQIDPQSLEPEKTVTYLYKHFDREKKFEEGNFIPYDPSTMSEYDLVPEQTRTYIQQEVAKGGKPLLFAGVPHILYLGEIDISTIPIVEI